MPEKYQDEIEEILKGFEEKEPPRPPRRTQPVIDDLPNASSDESPRDREQSNSGRATGARWKFLTPGKVALAGIILLLLGALNPLGIGLGWLVWLGLLGLAGAYLLFFVRPRPINQEKRWRGRSVESQSASQWQRIKRWLSG